MNTKTILLFGKHGQLGSSLYRQLGDEAVHAYDYPEIDFMSPDMIAELIDNIQPEIIINAAAYTNVDGAEANTESAMGINAQAVGIIAEKAKEIGAGFIHYSTDYVFDGKSNVQYRESDSTNPINFYGKSKLLGEENTVSVDSSYLIFRLSWVYSTEFPSFVTKVLEWSRKQETLRIVDDQVSKPSWAEMLAGKTIEIVNLLDTNNLFGSMEEVKGIYHLANSGEASRIEWARKILANDAHRDQQITENVLPVKSSEFPTPALRPNYTVMDCTKVEKTFNLSLPDWETSLFRAMSGKSCQ